MCPRFLHCEAVHTALCFSEVTLWNLTGLGLLLMDRGARLNTIGGLSCPNRFRPEMN